jgi:hypothetical protein
MLGCAWRATDRRWVSDRRFHQVWKYYESTGSIEQTEKLLRDQPWRPGEINECLYRIEQLERAQALYGPLNFPPRGEPRPTTGSTMRARL